MSGDDPNLRSIVCEALDRPNARDRKAYLDAACRGNAELRAKIESLLAAHDDAEGFLEGDSERPALGPTVVPSHSAEVPGAMIGRTSFWSRSAKGLWHRLHGGPAGSGSPAGGGQNHQAGDGFEAGSHAL
jgi:hypothetical protein